MILTVVDRLMCRAHFWPTKTTVTARELANLLMEQYLPLYGVPKSIVSDCDPHFISQFWGSFCSKLGMKLHMSMAFHLQSDGLSERLNCIVEDYLHSYLQNTKE